MSVNFLARCLERQSRRLRKFTDSVTYGTVCLVKMLGLLSILERHSTNRDCCNAFGVGCSPQPNALSAVGLRDTTGYSSDF